jgi:hypothetical protein
MLYRDYCTVPSLELQLMMEWMVENEVPVCQR